MTGIHVDNNSKNHLIVVHAGSSDGFINETESIYKASTIIWRLSWANDLVNFEKFIMEKLLPNLKPNSLICFG